MGLARRFRRGQRREAIRTRHRHERRGRPVARATRGRGLRRRDARRGWAHGRPPRGRAEAPARRRRPGPCGHRRRGSSSGARRGSRHVRAGDLRLAARAAGRSRHPSRRRPGGGPRRELSPARRRRARHELPARGADRHANGSRERRDRARAHGAPRRRRARRRHLPLRRRASVPQNRPEHQEGARVGRAPHDARSSPRGREGGRAGARRRGGPGDPHVPGAPHRRQRRAPAARDAPRRLVRRPLRGRRGGDHLVSLARGPDGEARLRRAGVDAAHEEAADGDGRRVRAELSSAERKLRAARRTTEPELE